MITWVYGLGSPGILSHMHEVQQVKLPHLQASYVQEARVCKRKVGSTQQTWTLYQIEMQLNPQP
jgi:hypothetical protein